LGQAGCLFAGNLSWARAVTLTEVRS
jgi:hypothetical protein